MGRLIIQPGDKYNLLTAIKKTDNRDSRVMWLFRCECGNETEIQACRVVKGTIKSCRCLSIKNVTIANTKHGLSGHPLFKVWSAMIERCSNPNNKAYHTYGAKGIRVCDEWKQFKTFYRDMADGYKKGLLLDRIKNEKGYSKDNCRWVDAMVSGQNTSQVKLNAELVIKIRAEKATAKALAEKYHVGLSTINDLRQRLTWKNI